MDITSILPHTLVVAFGHKSGQGKDTSAQAIIDKYGATFDIQRFAFADALKVEVYNALMNPLHEFWTGHHYFTLPHPRDSWASVTEKRKWVDDNKAELGGLLQKYGTDYRRAQNPFYWVNALRRTLESIRPTVALVTDMRFVNEALFVLAAKGVTVRCVREGYINPARPAAHQSETELDNFLYDYEIHATTVEDVRRDACDLFQMIVESQQPQNSEFTANEAVTLSGN